MKKWLSANWKPGRVRTLWPCFDVSATGLAEEGAAPAKSAPTLLENMKEAGFMEYILLFVSIAGLALCFRRWSHSAPICSDRRNCRIN